MNFYIQYLDKEYELIKKLSGKLVFNIKHKVYCGNAAGGETVAR